MYPLAQEQHSARVTVVDSEFSGLTVMPTPQSKAFPAPSAFPQLRATQLSPSGAAV
jgi:hypothetical protein